MTDYNHVLDYTKPTRKDLETLGQSYRERDGSDERQN